MRRLIVASLIMAGLWTLPAAAQCGSPPDPRTNTAGYASWCSCMGGSYNYQTTACTGASGPRRGGGPGTAADMWYCQARARNGAWGWGRFAGKADAEARALAECRAYARGQSCSIQYCRYGGGAAPPRAAPAPSAAPAASPGRVPAARAAYDCDVCHKKLYADVRSGWASAGVRSYVSQALAGYDNCKRRARGSCLYGDILARSLRNSCTGFSDPHYGACIGRIVNP